MYLIDWTAQVKTMHRFSTLSMNAQFRCPVCKAERRFETSNYVLPDDDLLRVVDKVFEDAVDTRACGECGVESKMPDSDQAKLRAQLKLQMTPEWVAAELIRQEGLEGVTP